jgi:hypothetical protein
MDELCESWREEGFPPRGKIAKTAKADAGFGQANL